jgi:hypothetical protein
MGPLSKKVLDPKIKFLLLHELRLGLTQKVATWCACEQFWTPSW